MPSSRFVLVPDPHLHVHARGCPYILYVPVSNASLQQATETCENEPKRTFLGMRGGGLIRKTMPHEKEKDIEEYTDKTLQSISVPASSAASAWKAAATLSMIAAAARPPRIGTARFESGRTWTGTYEHQSRIIQGFESVYPLG